MVDNLGYAIQAKNANINIGIPPDGSPEDKKPATPGSPSPMAWLVATLVFFFIVVASCIANLVNKAQNSFPEESGVRPIGSNDRSVKSAVFDKLQSCARAVVLKPQNCPQGAEGSYAQNVRWHIHGGPIEGAQLAWHEDRFYVRGNAVMTVSYLGFIQEQKFETHIVPFQAEVAWNNSKASVNSIYTVDTISDGVIKKSPISASEEHVRTVLQEAFGKCAASTVSPMPPECPNGLMAPSISDAVWTFDGDPTLNIRREFDESSGILHVIGSFAATVDYRHDSVFSGQARALYGNYDALIIKDGGVLRVLQIQSTA